jgi:hypothetical protein
MGSASQPGRKRIKRDTIRLLHRHPHRGYTDDPHRAAFAEPEAISAQDAEWIAYRVHRAERETQLQYWHARRAAIEREIDALHSARLGVGVSKQLRFMKRQLDHIERRVAAL